MKKNINNSMYEIAKKAAKIAYDAGYIKCLEDIKKMIKGYGGNIILNEEMMDIMIKEFPEKRVENEKI